MPSAAAPLTAPSWIARGAAILATSAVLLLTGCVDAGTAPELPAEPTDTPTTLPTGPVTPTTMPTAGAEPVAIPCDELVDPDAVYAFDPNYALIGSYDPPAGSAAEEALTAGGVACKWVRESGGGTIQVSVAQLSDAELVAKKNAAFAASQMVPTYGDEGYFEVEGGVGTAIVFPGSFWVVVSSEAFFEPGEPAGIIESIATALAAL